MSGDAVLLLGWLLLVIALPLLVCASLIPLPRLTELPMSRSATAEL